MKLEAVIICKDYSDYLEHTLPENLQHFDHVVVVTHHSDKRTIGLCHKLSVDCVQTHAFHEEDAVLNKGRAINVGLAHLKGLGWILHLDADTLLPHRFRNMLHRHGLNEANLYGADRVQVFGWDKYVELKEKHYMPHHSNSYFVAPPKGWPIGDRIIHMEHGYCPIGYFQLWHMKMGKSYPLNQGTAEHTDLLHAIKWHRSQRILMPEVFCYHLESNTGPIPKGANWNGRKTPFFGPPARASRESQTEGERSKEVFKIAQTLNPQSLATDDEREQAAQAFELMHDGAARGGGFPFPDCDCGYTPHPCPHFPSWWPWEWWNWYWEWRKTHPWPAL